MNIHTSEQFFKPYFSLKTKFLRKLYIFRKVSENFSENGRKSKSHFCPNPRTVWYRVVNPINLYFSLSTINFLSVTNTISGVDIWKVGDPNTINKLRASEELPDLKLPITEHCSISQGSILSCSIPDWGLEQGSVFSTWILYNGVIHSGFSLFTAQISVLNSNIQYSAAQYSTVQYSTAKYSRIFYKSHSRPILHNYSKALNFTIHYSAMF